MVGWLRLDNMGIVNFPLLEMRFVQLEMVLVMHCDSKFLLNVEFDCRLMLPCNFQQKEVNFVASKNFDMMNQIQVSRHHLVNFEIAKLEKELQ